MTKVLVFCEYSSLNGGERSLLSVLPHLGENGFGIEVAGPPEGELFTAIAALGVPPTPLPIFGPDGRRLAISEIRQRILRAVISCQPDLVHANSLSMSRLLGPVAREARIPSVGHLRDIITLSRAAIDDLNLNTRLLAVSNATRDWHISAGVDAHKTHVVYNGVDLQQFSPSPPTGFLHRELDLSPDAVLIASIGQIGLRKGLDTLLDAARDFLPRSGPAHLLIVGQRFSRKQESVDYENQLHRLASIAPLQGRVHFVGWRADLPRFMNELSLVVHAARQEPLGRVLLEAAAAGVPVVATDVGGTREIFPAPSPAARLVKPDDPVSLADAVVAVLSDHKLRQSMAIAGRQRIEDAFDARSAALAIAAHYREIISK